MTGYQGNTLNFTERSSETTEKNTPSVLVLSQLFYPEVLAAGKIMTELCEKLVDMGMDVEVMCGPLTVLDRKTYVPKYTEHHGIRINRVLGTRFPQIKLSGRIINEISYSFSVFFKLIRDTSKRPVLVLTHPPFPAPTCAFLQKIGRGKLYIYLILDVYPDTAVKLGLIKERGFIDRLWESVNIFTYKHASSILVTGRCMEEVIRKKVGASLPDKIHTIHMWSDDNLIQPVPRADNPFIRKWSLEEKFVVLYSGNMGMYHDLETVMETARILKGYKDIVFLFIGEGLKKPLMKEFARRHELTNCEFLPYVEREDLKFSLSCAHVGLVSLDRGHEGLSVPGKTYSIMAAGVPVIAVMSPTAEIARIIHEEECGIVVEPSHPEELEKAILTLYNNHQKLGIMGKNARRAIDTKYNLESAAKVFYKMISDINSLQGK